MSIVVAKDHPMFLLSTATTSYGLEVTDVGAVVNLYWGARLNSSILIHSTRTR